MIASEKTDQIFTVKRLSPEKVISILEERAKKARRAIPRSYNITNDSQRFEFLMKVLNKELTIKEVKLQTDKIGGSNLWLEIYYCQECAGSL
jgi:hypothetical protein